MACANCSTKSGSVPLGCNNNGNCGTSSCNKLNVFDWLSNMTSIEHSKFNIIEVRFKNSRKEFFKNTENFHLAIGDVVVTKANFGYDIGVVTLTGELVKIQMKKKGINDTELLNIYRKATQEDLDKWENLRQKEEKIQVRAREIAINLNLEMKISDIEFQGDGSKAIFYYTASERVDFRQLIREFAREFSTRIEMKQIGLRQEASRLGGIGSCGRELCCSTWLTDFRSVNTSAARYQQLSINPQKLAGQCGKLKCCLNYELDSYLDALKDFPDIDTTLQTEKGTAICQKIDIFKELMWFTYKENTALWYIISVENVKKILNLNKQGKKNINIEYYTIESSSSTGEISFKDSLEQDSLTRFDNKRTKNRNKQRYNRKKNEVKS